MTMPNSRAGPGKEREAGEGHHKHPRPPDTRTGRADPAISNGSSPADPGQAAHVTQYTRPDRTFVFDLPVLWQSGPEVDGQYRVDLTLLGAIDGGVRQHHVERLLFTPGHADEREEPDDQAGVRELPPGAPRPGSGSVAMEVEVEEADEPAGVR